MNHEERVAYVEALMCVATLNEKVEEKELEYFNQVGQLYGLNSDEIELIKKGIVAKEKTLEDILAPITDRKIKLALVYELLALCYVDGSYDLIEKKGMMEICNILKIEESKLHELESVILENIELQNKINTILERI